MTITKKKPSDRPRGSRPENSGTCPCCKKAAPFLWTCKCGFAFCQSCMLDNTWGVTCNNVTWTCPDCGELRSC